MKTTLRRSLLDRESRKNRIVHNNQGQALLTLLVVVVMATTIIAGAVSMSAINAKSTSQFALSQESYKIAEAGVEKAILSLLRDESYTTEVLTLGSGTATINVSGSNPYTITSQGQATGFIRTIQVVVSNTNNVLIVNSWQEIN